MLAANLEGLRSGKGVVTPVWCFQEHRRVGWRHVEPDDLIICEGIFALHASVRPLLDLGVYVDAPASVRWRRWEHLEVSGARGWGVERAREYFSQVADPTFLKHAKEYRDAADLVVDNGDESSSPGRRRT
ncbi:MAG: hypothetical protein IPJ41_09155 [Phycisphaerales bacterium]|nr:hypothetical protein [Phycisphaerales bacterium]